MNYVIPFFLKNQLESACEKLIKESTQCWKQVINYCCDRLNELFFSK